MANTGQLAPWIEGQGMAWYFDDTYGEIVPSYDLQRGIGTPTARILINRLVPVGNFFWTAAAGTAVTAASETSLLAGAGVKKGPAWATAGTIPASFLNSVGKSGYVRAHGVIASTGSTPTNNIKFKLGSNVILATGAIATASVTGTLPWFFEGDFVTLTTGATGTIKGQGRFTYYTTAPVVVEWAAYSAAAVTVDLTATQVIDLTSTWSATTGSPTMTCQGCVVGFYN